MTIKHNQNQDNFNTLYHTGVIIFFRMMCSFVFLSTNGPLKILRIEKKILIMTNTKMVDVCITSVLLPKKCHQIYKINKNLLDSLGAT